MESYLDNQSERDSSIKMRRELYKEENAASLKETKKELMQSGSREKFRAESDGNLSAGGNEKTRECASNPGGTGTEHNSTESAEADVDQVSATSEASPQSVPSASTETGDGESDDSNNGTDSGSDSCSTSLGSDSVSGIWSVTDNEESDTSDEESDISSEYKLGATNRRRAPKIHHPNVITAETGYDADDEKPTETEWRLEHWQKVKGPYVSRWVEDVNRTLFPDLVEPQENKEDHESREDEEWLAALTSPTNTKVTDASKPSSEVKTEAHATANFLTCCLQSEALASTYDADVEYSGEDTSSDESECEQLFGLKRVTIDERGYEADDDKPNHEQARRLFRWKQVAVRRWVDDVHGRMFPNEDQNQGQPNIRARLSQAWARFATGARRILRCCVGLP